jgi:hypothetical protein
MTDSNCCTRLLVTWSNSAWDKFVKDAFALLSPKNFIHPSTSSILPRVQVPLEEQVVDTIAGSVMDPVNRPPLYGPYHRDELSTRRAPSHLEESVRIPNHL